MIDYNLINSHVTFLTNYFNTKMYIEFQDPKFRPGQSVTEMYILAMCVALTRDLKCDLAEVGVYSGGSALHINSIKHPDQKMYLFDTFQGLMDCQMQDAGGRVWNGMANSVDELRITVDDIKKNFKDQNVEIITGYFPESAPEEFENKIFSFVHLDTDTYASTLNCINYFYPKMSSGGIIVVHDYVNDDAPGVKKAVDELTDLFKLKVLIVGADSTQAVIFKE